MQSKDEEQQQKRRGGAEGKGWKRQSELFTTPTPFFSSGPDIRCLSADAPPVGARVRLKLPKLPDLDGQLADVKTQNREHGLLFVSLVATPGEPMRVKEANAQHVCHHCGCSAPPTSKLSVCARCHGAWYCGKECQRDAWKAHKKVCGKGGGGGGAGAATCGMKDQAKLFACSEMVLKMQTANGENGPGDNNVALELEDDFMRLCWSVGVVDNHMHPFANGFAVACGLLGTAHLYAGHDALCIARGTTVADETERITAREKANPQLAEHHFERSVYFYKKDLEIAQVPTTTCPDTDVQGAQIARGNLARALSELKRYGEAIELLEERLKIAQQTREVVPDHVVNLLVYLRENHGGSCGVASMASETTIEFLLQRLERVRADGDKLEQCSALTAVAHAYSKRGQSKKALKFYLHDLQLAREMGDDEGEVISLGNVGKTYMELQEPAQAIKHFKEICKVAWRNKSREQFIEGFEKQGVLLLGAGRRQRGREGGKEGGDAVSVGSGGKTSAIATLEFVRVLRSGAPVEVRHWEDNSKTLLLPQAEPDPEGNHPQKVELLGRAYVGVGTKKMMARQGAASIAWFSLAEFRVSGLGSCAGHEEDAGKESSRPQSLTPNPFAAGPPYEDDDGQGLSDS